MNNNNRHLLLLRIVLLFAIQFYGPVTFGQDADSLRFVKPCWKKERIANGVFLIKQQFFENTLFGSNQFISYIIIKNKKRNNRFHVAAEVKQLKTTSAFADATNATVAINGNFFNIKNGGSEDYVKVNGEVISRNTVSPGGKTLFHQMAAVLIENGRLTIRKGTTNSGWPDTCNAATVMCNGPLLLMNGHDEVKENNAFSKNRHPRTAVGTTTKGRVVLLVADGRNANAAGLSLEELTKIMRWLGCTGAINFDGGGSSTLWVKNKGVINHPSDNKKWDHEGQRKVANVLYYKR